MIVMSPDENGQGRPCPFKKNLQKLSGAVQGISPTMLPALPVASLDGDTYQPDFQVGTGSRTDGQSGEDSQPIDSLVRPAGIEPATLSLEG